jgi:hypothetical protein
MLTSSSRYKPSVVVEDDDDEYWNNWYKSVNRVSDYVTKNSKKGKK